MELNHRLQHVALVSCRLTTRPWSGRSRSRTDKITSLSSWPLFQFAYSAMKWQVQESHLAGEGYEPWLGTGPPASRRFRFREFGADMEAACAARQLQAPESNRGDRPYESQLGASRACIELRVTKGRVELPSPYGHDVLSVACLPVAPLGPNSACHVAQASRLCRFCNCRRKR
jgi:hypothetical protein